MKINLFILLSLCLYGCSKKINNINDFSMYSDLKKEADIINVTYDNYLGSPFYFSITNQEEINDIMNIIFSSHFEKIGKEINVNGGSHTSILIIQGEKEYTMPVHYIKNGRYYYSFITYELEDKINEIAKTLE